MLFSGFEFRNLPERYRGDLRLRRQLRFGHQDQGQRLQVSRSSSGSDTTVDGHRKNLDEGLKIWLIERKFKTGFSQVFRTVSIV